MDDEPNDIYQAPAAIRALGELGLIDFHELRRQFSHLKAFAEQLELAVIGVSHVLVRQPPESAIKALLPVRELLDLHGSKIWPAEGVRPWLIKLEHSPLVYSHDEAWR